MTSIRVRYPDRVRFDRERLGLLPISLATATPAPAATRSAATVTVITRPIAEAPCAALGTIVSTSQSYLLRPGGVMKAG